MNKFGIKGADSRACYIMVGGFLGAGKTTALGWLGRRLAERGLSVGLITNDQSVNLVDTALLRSQGFDVEEIAGGCFCCRFNSLRDAARRLDASNRPDVFLAEPVGSCTDLVATVSYPLRRIYKDRFLVAPLSVLVDPLRAARIFGLREGRAFSPKVEYVYRKQLEEAEIIVLNKIDLLEDGFRRRLQEALGREYPDARVVACSLKCERGLQDWLGLLEGSEAREAPTMEVDYEAYAQGEAELGWLNCTVALRAAQRLDANEALLGIARRIAGGIESQGGEVAHLKMTLDPGLPSGELAVVSLTRGGEEPELRASLLETVRAGDIILNLRAEASPEILREAVEAALDADSMRLAHLEFFRPAKPVPVHRVQVAG